MTAEHSDLKQIVEGLRDVALHASVRALDGELFVFAVGRARRHSLEIRKTKLVYRLTTWQGPDGNDRLVQELEVNSIDQATGAAVEWLSRDHI